MRFINEKMYQWDGQGSNSGEALPAQTVKLCFIDACNRDRARIELADETRLYVGKENLHSIPSDLPEGPLSLEQLEEDEEYDWTGLSGLYPQPLAEPGVVTVLRIEHQPQHPLPVQIESDCGDTYWITPDQLTARD